MPIKYVPGDLTESQADIIFHGCNCYCVMGSGVARALRAKWSEVFEADLQTKPGDSTKMGTFSIATIPGTKTQVLNMYTQFKFGGLNGPDIDYAAVRSCMNILRDYLSVCDPKGTMTVAGPRIGAGLAGGDWKIIASIIENTFPDREIRIYTI